MFSRHNVLTSKKGFATTFVLGFFALITTFAVGVIAVNYAYQSNSVTQTKNLVSAIEDRANQFAAEKNRTVSPAGDGEDIVDTTSKFDARTGITTIIEPVTGSATDVAITASMTGIAIKRIVELNRIEVTHISGFDDVGNAQWVNSAEPRKLELWSFAAGSVRELTPEDTAATGVGGGWKMSGSRVGIDSAGHLWAWGANDAGQAGVGSTAVLTEPQPVKPATVFSDVVSDATSTFAIDENKFVWAWGANTSSKLGTSPASTTPVRAGFTQRTTALDTDANSTFAIDSRARLWAWGSNVSGRLGTGSAATSFAIEQQVAVGQSFRDVSTSGGSTLALDTAGKLWAWGVNDVGQLGVGAPSGVVTLPRAVAPTLTFSSVSIGGKSVVAVSNAGKLYAWGAAGRAGDGTNVVRSAPVAVSSTGLFRHATAGPTTTYAISTTGKLFAWGGNDTGQYGDGTTTAVLTPKGLLPTLNFGSIRSDRDSNVASAIETRGDLWVFGTADGAGIWQIDFSGEPESAFKMPLPNGFTN